MTAPSRGNESGSACGEAGPDHKHTVILEQVVEKLWRVHVISQDILGMGIRIFLSISQVINAEIGILWFMSWRKGSYFDSGM